MVSAQCTLDLPYYGDTAKQLRQSQEQHLLILSLGFGTHTPLVISMMKSNKCKVFLARILNY